MAEQPAPPQDDEAIAAQWAADRAQEAAPLPHADQARYGDVGERNVALAAAQRNNEATAAGDVGLTTDQWLALRHKLGHAPTRGDVRRAS